MSSDSVTSALCLCLTLASPQQLYLSLSLCRTVQHFHHFGFSSLCKRGPIPLCRPELNWFLAAFRHAPGKCRVIGPRKMTVWECSRKMSRKWTVSKKKMKMSNWKENENRDFLVISNDTRAGVDLGAGPGGTDPNWILTGPWTKPFLSVVVIFNNNSLKDIQWRVAQSYSSWQRTRNDLHVHLTESGIVHGCWTWNWPPLLWPL